MAATAITKPTPYFGPGRTKYILITSAITDQTTGVPTRAEINAGSDITPAVADWTGGEFTANSQEVQDWSTLNTSKVPNFNSLSDITLTTNADVAGADVRASLVQDANVQIYVMDTGDTPTRKMTGYFVTVASKSIQIGTGSNAKYVFGLTVTKRFGDIAIPA